MNILVVNAGSSTLKLRVIGEDDGVLVSESLESATDPRVEGSSTEDALESFVRGKIEIDAVGHRIVHGGPRFREPTIIDADTENALWALGELAPQHNPPSLRLVGATRHLLPRVPHVACFDTAFHKTMSPLASTYAIPMPWRQQWGLLRYGFHGLSHSYASRRVAELLGKPSRELRTVTCHLGAGASLAAVAGGASVDTTMGFTPLEGLVMATRSGSVDPGVILWLIQKAGLGPEKVEAGLERESGLLGLSGASSDMRWVIAAADHGDEQAGLALGVYIHRLRSGIASMAASMEGMDALAFTGGVGEGSDRVRRDCCAGLGFLGVRLDESSNRDLSEPDRDLTGKGSKVAVAVLEAREDLEIARATRHTLFR